jgi:hypothetical protein
MCILLNFMHPSVLNSGRHASVVRNVGSLVAHMSVPRYGVCMDQILLLRFLRTQFVCRTFESPVLAD